MIKKSFQNLGLVAIVVVLWLVLNILLFIGPFPINTQTLEMNIGSLVVSSTLSLSGILFAVIGILVAIYWSGTLAGNTKVRIKGLVIILAAISILSTIACLLAFAQILTNESLLILPTLMLFISVIYFSIIATILLLNVLIG